MEFLAFLCVAIGLPYLLLGFLEVFAPESGIRDNLRHRLMRFKLRHLLIAVALAGLLFAMFVSRGPEPWLLAGLIILTLFLKAWRDEFTFLMSLGDQDFPGRHDKMIWAIMLLFFAPVGLPFFRSYHLAHWPEVEARINSDAVATGSAAPEPT